MIRVFHYRNKCIGCNACVEADKDVWRISRKDGKSILIGGKEVNGIFKKEFEDEKFQFIRQAVKNCPVKIIKAEIISK